MKKVMKKITATCLASAIAVIASTSFTSCIDEVQRTSGATEEQVTGSETAIASLVGGLNSYATNIWNSSSFPASFGYPALMIIRDIQSGELAYGENANGCLFLNWLGDTYLSREYMVNQFLWYYQTQYAGAATEAINSIDPEANDVNKGYYAAALAYRAMLYIDMAREYEWLPNDKTQGVSPEGNPIEGLTVPIVKEGMTEDEWQNNPRATREEMAAFILDDLNKAAEYIGYLTDNSKTMPHLDCIYGLMARCYMWIEDYPNAEKYARMAIDNSSSQPITESEAMNTSTGYNDINLWMWGTQYYTGYVNNLYCWTANMCNEISYGYTGTQLGTYVQIDASMYNRISNGDWRKLLWKAPAGSALDGDNIFINSEVGAGLPDYTSLKFRPGGGSTNDYTVGNVTSVPFMRIEEMYFIEAEAAAHQDAARGTQLLEDFMKRHRNPNYTCTNPDVVGEIVFQKAVELWGEGQYFFDIKRLNMPVTKYYTGTNQTAPYRFNTTTRPSWMNWQISQLEEVNNAAVNGYNNPTLLDMQYGQQ